MEILPTIIYVILQLVNIHVDYFLLSLAVDFIEQFPEQYILLLYEIKYCRFIYFILSDLKITNTVTELIRIKLAAISMSIHYDCGHWNSHTATEWFIDKFSVSAVPIENSFNNVQLQWTYMHLRPPTALRCIKYLHPVVIIPYLQLPGVTTINVAGSLSILSSFSAN